MEQLEKDIQAVLERQVRPVLKAHMGDIELTGIEEGGIVHLRILGACATCVGAEQTVSDIIVASIRESCPWVSDVRVSAGVSDDLVRDCGFSRGLGDEADDGGHPVLRWLQSPDRPGADCP